MCYFNVRNDDHKQNNVLAQIDKARRHTTHK